MTADLQPLNRRAILRQCGMGFGGLALPSLLGMQASASEARNPLAAHKPHYAPTAKRIVHIFLNGGPSHVDMFDPKPMLAKYAGQPLPNKGTLLTERKTGAAFPSPFTFSRHGQSGLELSELLKLTAKHADDLCVVRSMHALVPNHEPSLMLMNCGDAVQARPSFGSWLLYGLGTDNQNLPGFVAMCPGGYPIKDVANWQSGFLPGIYQGAYVNSGVNRVEQLIENIRSPHATQPAQRAQLDLLQLLNRKHLQTHADIRMEARLESFELAFRMQMEATDAFDVLREPQHIRELYGDSHHGRQALIARRLLERGVRVVQLWHGAGQPWDNHNDIEKNLRKLCPEVDQPLAALLTDLKQRGMLEDTLVLVGCEFGRTPTVELSAAGKAQLGRDHNHYGFSVMLAGGGIKGGATYGSTDEFGFKAAENLVSVHDLHATMLHCMGFDHERLTYRYAGRDFRLTDVEGRVVREILG